MTLLLPNHPSWLSHCAQPPLLSLTASPRTDPTVLQVADNGCSKRSDIAKYLPTVSKKLDISQHKVNRKWSVKCREGN